MHFVDQVAMAPKSHPGHTARSCGSESVVMLTVPCEDSFATNFALFLMVFRRMQSRCQVWQRWLFQGNCHDYQGEHPLITRSHQVLMFHETAGCGLVSSLESGILFFQFSVFPDVVSNGSCRVLPIQQRDVP